MQFIKVKDYEAVSKLAHDMIKKELSENKEAVISFTTGYSPKLTIDLLAQSINDGLDISQATFMNLDEYVCPRDMDISVHSFMHKTLYNVINQQPKNKFLINGDASDMDTEINAYKQILKDYPRDIQVLGLGVNGHIGANEPGDDFDKEVFVSNSRERSIVRHMEQYGLSREDVPKQMVTLGMKDVMAAKIPLLLVSGKDKAEAMRNLVHQAIDTEYPATILRSHENFICIYDEDAGSLI